MKKIILFAVLASLCTVYSFGQTITANKTYVCEGETVTYTISGVPSGTTYQWQTSSNMVLQTSATGSSATYKAVFDSNKGYGRVTVALTRNGQVSYLDNAKVWVGAPTPQYINLYPSGNCYNKLCLNIPERIYVDANLEKEQGVKEYDWKLYAWQRYITGYETRNGIQKTGITLNLPADAPTRATVVVTPYNGCPSKAFTTHVQEMEAITY